MIVKFTDHMGFDYENPDPYETDISRDTSGYHAGSVSSWMESLESDKPRIGFVRDTEPTLDTDNTRHTDSYADVENIPDPSWLLL